MLGIIIKTGIGNNLKPVIPVMIILFFYSCDLVDSNINDRFSIQTEKSSYKLGNTKLISTTFTNNLGSEVTIYNSSCGGPYFIIERYDGKSWVLFSKHPMCETLPAEPIKLANGKNISLGVNISLMRNIISGWYRMKFEIKWSSNNVNIDDKYLHSNSFSFIQN